MCFFFHIFFFCYCHGSAWQLFTAAEERSVCQEAPRSRRELKGCYLAKCGSKLPLVTQCLSPISREMVTDEETFTDKTTGEKNGKTEGLKEKNIKSLSRRSGPRQRPQGPETRARLRAWRGDTSPLAANGVIFALPGEHVLVLKLLQFSRRQMSEPWPRARLAS